MLVFRASRRPRAAFDPLDSSASVARDGWRYNDKPIEILHAAGVESLAILEVVARPGWENVIELTVAAIDVPDGSIVDLGDLGITLPSNWNMRPAAPNAQRIGAEFVAAMDREHSSHWDPGAIKARRRPPINPCASRRCRRNPPRW
jgi:RES domain-containing protein